MNIIDKLFGTHSERELKLIMPTIDKIEALRPTMQALSDEELRDKTKEYKQRLAEGRHWMTFFRRHLPLSVRLQSVCLEWNTTGYS